MGKYNVSSITMISVVLCDYQRQMNEEQDDEE